MRTMMTVAVMVMVVVTTLLQATTSRADDDEQAWNTFKTRFGKRYANATDNARRRAIWLYNRKMITSHNEQARLGKFTYTLAENALADLLPAEYEKMLGYRNSSAASRQQRRHRSKRSAVPPPMPTYYNTVDVDTLPSYVNWTQSGWVGPVMNQGQCGSCWSYSATGSMQSQYYNNTRKMVVLSQQNLIDSGPQGNQGCNGGNVQNAFWYVQLNGIESLADYPDVSNVTGESMGTCRYSASDVVMNVSSWMNIDSGSEDAQQQAVALVGPVSVAIDARGPQFQLYQSGVYSNPYCSRFNLDHAVLVVGYGVYNNEDYWLIQNSWGTSWGMNGYMMMARNDGNMCGVATDSTFPLMDTSSLGDSAQASSNDDGSSDDQTSASRSSISGSGVTSLVVASSALVYRLTFGRQ